MSSRCCAATLLIVSATTHILQWGVHMCGLLCLCSLWCSIWIRAPGRTRGGTSNVSRASRSTLSLPRLQIARYSRAFATTSWLRQALWTRGAMLVVPKPSSKGWQMRSDGRTLESQHLVGLLGSMACTIFSPCGTSGFWCTCMCACSSESSKLEDVRED